MLGAPSGASGSVNLKRIGDSRSRTDPWRRSIFGERGVSIRARLRWRRTRSPWAGDRSDATAGASATAILSGFAGHHGRVPGVPRETDPERTSLTPGPGARMPRSAGYAGE